MPSVFILGVTSIVFQLLFFREFFCSVSSNELTLSLLLFHWLLLNGLGAWSGARISRKIRPLFLFHALAALLPPFTLALMRAGKNLVFIPGRGARYRPPVHFFLSAPGALLPGQRPLPSGGF